MEVLHGETEARLEAKPRFFDGLAAHWRCGTPCRRVAVRCGLRDAEETA